jgi:hypothetical protein
MSYRPGSPKADAESRALTRRAVHRGGCRWHEREDVPPDNIVAMWETFQGMRDYPATSS